MNVEEIAKQYYNAITVYEDYLKSNDFEMELNNYSEKEKEIYGAINGVVREMYERRYTPWRLLEGDIVENLKSIFSEGGDNIMNYIAVCDGIGDELTELAEEELKKYYSNQGKIIDDHLENEIIEEAISLHLKEIIDKNIYSEELLKLHSIARMFDDVCDKLYKFYKEQSYENERSNNLIDDKELEELREKYPSETKIKLTKTMDDIQPIEAGSIGEVDYIDDAGSIHMKWENGRSLALIEGVDSFEIISKPEKIKVIVVEPEKEPYVKEIYSTLKEEQKLVGGLIQCTPSFFDEKDTYDFMTNEEGKLLGLPLNRYVYDKQDIIDGNLVIVKVDNEQGEFISLEDNEIDSLIQKINEQCPKYEKDISLNHDEMEEIEK